MNKQQLLDKENPTTKEWVVQQLLIANSKTSIGEVNRTMRKIYNALYKTIARNLSLNDIYEAVDAATRLANGENIENHEIHISTQQPEKLADEKGKPANR